MAPLIYSIFPKSTLAAERLALDARIADLSARTMAPGSALACLDGIVGNTVETACEKRLFASPETLATSLAYVSAQISLLADLVDFGRRGGIGYDTIMATLRHAAETDRYGIFAHLLVQRDGCTADQCAAFTLIKDAHRVRSNITDNTYDSYVQRHYEAWGGAPPPTVEKVTTVGAFPQSPPEAGGPRKPTRDLFFPSASSIPAVNIMVAEPATAHQADAPNRTPAPSTRRSAQPAPSQTPVPHPPAAQSAPSQPPVAQQAAPGQPLNLNAVTR
jgi:hypothetical protein